MLRIPILVNEYKIAQITALRMANFDDPDAEYPYRWVYHDEKTGVQQSGTITHRYSDRWQMLVRNILDKVIALEPKTNQ